jgi:membrane protease YdiL (CAAX protease family)
MLRWWDGNAWSDEWMTPTAPEGWYPAPEGGGHLRWWNGALWTDHSSAPQRTVKEPQPTFDARAAAPTIAGVALSVILSRVLSAIVFDRVGHSLAAAIAAAEIPVYGGLAMTCALVSARYGTGKPTQDFGLRIRPRDLWVGPLVFVAANLVAIALTVALRQDQVQRRTSDVLRHGVNRFPVLAIVELALAAVVAAPLLEELVFRGALQRSLTTRFGAGWAVVLQAAVFGAYHFDPMLGTANVVYALSLGTVGLVFGFAALRWRRIGPGIIAHFLFNAVFVFAVVAVR